MSWATAAWWAVIGLGLFHGLNPAMGWPLAVASGLLERKAAALGRALALLALGHFLAVLLLLLPFALLARVAQWQDEIRLVLGGVVILGGLLVLLRRGHLRGLARIRPGQLALWSFAVAMAHGAALMLVPIFFGMCLPAATGTSEDAFFGRLISSNLDRAFVVALVHSAAMLTAGGLCAWLTYRYLGLTRLRRAWWNTEALWGGSLVVVGLLSLGAAH